MLPLLTFASGLVAGIVGIRLIKKVGTPQATAPATGLETIGDKARHGLDKAQTSLRQATVSGLSTIEKSSASLREKLAAVPAEAPAQPAKPAAARKPARAKPATEAAKPKTTTARPARKKTPAPPAPGSATES